MIIEGAAFVQFCLEDGAILTKSFIGALHISIKPHILLKFFTRSHGTLHAHLTDNIIMLLDTLSNYC